MFQLGNSSPDSQKANAKLTQLEALIGSKKRIGNVAKDIVQHFDHRQSVFDGKAMVVAMSRRIAAMLYKAIIEVDSLPPEGGSSNLRLEAD